MPERPARRLPSPRRAGQALLLRLRYGRGLPCPPPPRPTRGSRDVGVGVSYHGAPPLRGIPTAPPFVEAAGTGEGPQTRVPRLVSRRSWSSGRGGWGVTRGSRRQGP